MPRWEEGSKERLQVAAMELFEKQGFNETSAVEIAKRARVTTRTFFRYFSDKEEVLFVDADQLYAKLVEDLLASADVTEPLVAVTTTLAQFDWESLGSRETLRRREAMIASTPGLLERELIKQQQMASGLIDALRKRGVDADTAELATRVGVNVFQMTYRRWLEGYDNDDMQTVTDSVMALLGTVVPARTSTTRPTSRTTVKRKKDVVRSRNP
jgi:AcrR family transcriptional regulator